MKRKNVPHWKRDSALVLLSIIASAALVQWNLLDAFIVASYDYLILASFISGFFFTSLFTIAPASVALAELAQVMPVVPLMISGALGAVAGDLVLYLFVRDAISDDIARMVSRSWKRRLATIFSHPLLQWIVPIAGALIIASPLPDELGVALMGLSKTRLIVLVPVSFAMNALGIALIWFAAQAF